MSNSLVNKISADLEPSEGKHSPAEEVDVEEDVLAVIKVEVCRLNHNLPDRFRRGTEHDD